LPLINHKCNFAYELLFIQLDLHNEEVDY
jgi:hypothetical protein